MPVPIRTVSAALLLAGNLLPAQAGIVTDRRQTVVDPASSRATLVETGWLQLEGPDGLIGCGPGSRSLGEVQLGGHFEWVTTTDLYSEDPLGQPLATPIRHDWYSFENLDLTGLEGLPELVISIDAWPLGAGEIYGSDSLCERPLPPWSYAGCFSQFDFSSVKDWVRGTLTDAGITLIGQIKTGGGTPGATTRYYQIALSGSFAAANRTARSVPAPAPLALLLVALPWLGRRAGKSEMRGRGRAH